MLASQRAQMRVSCGVPLAGNADAGERRKVSGVSDFRSLIVVSPEVECGRDCTRAESYRTTLASRSSRDGGYKPVGYAYLIFGLSTA